MDLNIFSNYANKIWFSGRVHCAITFRRVRVLVLVAYQQSVQTTVHLEYAVIETLLRQ